MKSSFLCLIIAIFVLPLPRLAATRPVSGEAPAQAGQAKVSPDPKMKFKPSRRIKTLLVTANYRSPAILAELARRKKGVPYLLLPAVNEPKAPVLFVPADKTDAFSLKDGEFAEFVDFLNPEQVVILGDELIVPEGFRPEKNNERRVVHVNYTSWDANAAAFGNLILMREMPERYRKIFDSNVEIPLRGLTPIPMMRLLEMKRNRQKEAEEKTSGRISVIKSEEKDSPLPGAADQKK